MKKPFRNDSARVADLLSAIHRAQSLFISGHDPAEIYEELLHLLIRVTDSGYGFLDEVRRDADGSFYKLNLAMSDISWDESSRTLYRKLIDRRFEFRNLDNLAGAPVLQGRLVIANDVAGDPLFRGLPPGHPALLTYMGIPVYYDNDLIGVAGVANRDGGYSEEVAGFVEPLIQTCAVLIHSQRQTLREAENLAALRESEERYRRIVETTNEGIWVMDQAHVTTYVNRRMADMLGHAPEVMLGKRVESFVFPEDMDSHLVEMDNRKQGRDAVYERRFRRQDGSELWCLVSAKAVRDEQGGFLGSLAMLTDISEHKRTVKALRESRDLLDMTQHLAHIGGWEWDVAEGSLTWTDETWRIHGFEPGSVLGGDELVQRSIACYDPDQQSVIGTAFRRCLEKGEPYDLESPFTAADGRKMWVQTMGRPVLDGNRIVKVLGNIMDISERKQAELYMAEAYRALKVEKEKMQRYLDTADTLIVALDKAGTVTMLNRYGLELLGYGEHEIIGRNWFKIALPQPAGREEVYPVFQAIMRGEMEQTAYHENEIVTANGSRRLIAWRNTFLRDELGNPVGTLSTGMDLTNHRETERRNQRLQKAESLRRMAGAVAHHFNNQLHAVMGNIEMAGMDLPKEWEAAAQALEEAMKAAGRAADMSAAMLIYLGQSFSEHTVHDLSALCRRSLDRLLQGLPGAITLHADLPERGPRVSADADQIFLLLDHLVQNATEAIGLGPGTIRVSIQTWASEEIPSLERFPGDWQPTGPRYIALSVSDTGCGIAAGDLERLFDPFFTSKLTGRGLGLPVCLGVALAHGGAILVQSEPRQGSVFRLILPQVDP